MIKKDAGEHYRKFVKVKITEHDIKNGFVLYQIDPARICKTFGVNSLLIGQAVKKLLVAGGRGHKNKKQDLLDIINAANREIEMMEEDE